MFLIEQFQNISVRFLKAPNGESVIIATDLIEALKGNKNNSSEIVKNNVRSKWWIDLPNPNGGHKIRCLFEPGAYQLAGNPMFQTEFAEKFQDWLFEDVLPKLRSQGLYVVQNHDESLTDYQAREASLLAANQKLQSRLSYATDLLATDIKTFLSRGLPHLTSRCVLQDANRINRMMTGAGVPYVEYRDRYHVYSLSDLHRYTSEHFGADSSYTRQTAQYWNI
jgi:prophage antirepressor-like protein